MGILKLLKYAAYLDLFEQIGKALSLGKSGDNFDVSSGLSIGGKKKIIEVSMRDA